jgi:hypothetical protein
MGTIQGTSRQNHLGGIWVLLEGWKVVLVALGDLSISDATYGDVVFKSGKTQTPFRFAFEFNMHGNEEHNEGR